ncbi:UNVERIFIED_CONTAM: hypothetical protein PYX00_008180 [Menopon gallinae]|uniref:EF-hand domain-containing protein n=1 Tax=Menopon gallinae TaxID=328185 RepID=A0AAW2HN57_9NEOP
MNITSDDRYRCKQVMGFFAEQDGRMLSPQFSILSVIDQDVLVTISPIDNDVGARLALIHRDPCTGERRLLGFTGEKNGKSEYFFAGAFPVGKLLLVPVDGHAPSENPRPNYQYEDYVTLFEHVDGSLCYTQRAEEALEYLFAMIDADNNGYLSRSEMAVFKKFLGLGHAVTEDEWSDVLFGWQEGDLDCTLTEISCEFFKKFVMRLCRGRFTFGTDILQGTVYKTSSVARRIKYLETIFASFGFDKDLVPSCNSRYIIRIYSHRNLLSNFALIPKEKMNAEEAIRHVTCILGKKKTSSNREISLSILRNNDWFSVAVANNSDYPKKVKIDCSRSVGARPVKPGFVWEGLIPEHREMLALRLARRREAQTDFEVHCAVIYETEKRCNKCYNIL